MERNGDAGNSSEGRNVDGGGGVRNGVNWKGRSVMECDGRSGNGAGVMSERRKWT